MIENLGELENDAAPAYAKDLSQSWKDDWGHVVKLISESTGLSTTEVLLYRLNAEMSKFLVGQQYVLSEIAKLRREKA